MCLLTCLGVPLYRYAFCTSLHNVGLNNIPKHEGYGSVCENMGCVVACPTYGGVCVCVWGGGGGGEMSKMRGFLFISDVSKVHNKFGRNFYRDHAFGL